MIAQLSNPFGGSPASFSADNAPAVNGSLPHPSVMAGAINSSSCGGVAAERTTSWEQPLDPRVESRKLRPGPHDSISTPDSFIPSVRSTGAAARIAARLFSSVRVRDANSFMRR